MKNMLKKLVGMCCLKLVQEKIKAISLIPVSFGVELNIAFIPGVDIEAALGTVPVGPMLAKNEAGQYIYVVAEHTWWYSLKLHRAIIAHEVGHLKLGHLETGETGLLNKQEFELAADAYAASLGYAPILKKYLKRLVFGCKKQGLLDRETELLFQERIAALEQQLS
jgi:hypothetical protein